MIGRTNANSNLNNVIKLSSQTFSFSNTKNETTSKSLTWDVTSYTSNYADLTVDNFYTGITSHNFVHNGYASCNITYAKSYNASTGILTVTCTIAPESGQFTLLSVPVQPIIIL